MSTGTKRTSDSTASSQDRQASPLALTYPGDPGSPSTIFALVWDISRPKWGLAPSGDCDCGTPQTADHLISDCPQHLGLYGEKGLIDLDVETRDWLEGVPC